MLLPLSQQSECTITTKQPTIIKRHTNLAPAPKPNFFFYNTKPEGDFPTADYFSPYKNWSRKQFFPPLRIISYALILFNVGLTFSFIFNTRSQNKKKTVEPEPKLNNAPHC